MKPSISIVIPAYNEEQRLPRTLERVVAYFRSGDWKLQEILVIDDGSLDGTAAAAEPYRDHEPRLRVLRNPGNRGKGYSVRHGMLEARGDWVLFTDADLSAPIEELDKLWDAVKRTGALVAMGSRALDRSLIGVHQSAFREQGGKLFNLFVQAITGLYFWDTQCGFKLFEGKLARKVFERVRTPGFGFDAESLFVARLLGAGITEVPVRWNHVEGTKMGLFSDSLKMIVDLFRIRANQLMGRYR